MDLLQATFMGLLQGLTEFLPVSSSGHLALLEELWGSFTDSEIQLFFNVMLHIGTLLAVVVFCWREVMMLLRALIRVGRKSVTPEHKTERSLLINLLLASLPTAVIGLAIKLTVAALFTNLMFVGSMFLVTAAFLWASRRLSGSGREPSFLSALVIGAAQGLAVFPGISRSGAAIVVGKASGLEGSAAARFAFVISIPAIFGAAIISWLDVANLPNFNTGLMFSLLCGIMTAAFVGYLSLVWLLEIVRRAQLQIFAFYCAAIGALTLVLGFVR